MPDKSLDTIGIERLGVLWDLLREAIDAARKVSPRDHRRLYILNEIFERVDQQVQDD